MFRLTDKDRGAKALVRQIGSVNKVAVDVGVLGAKASAPDGQGATVGEIATWAEFGIGQPERSWCRAWVDSNAVAVQSLSRRAVAAVAKGMPALEGVLALGLKVASGMQERIAAGIAPANAPSTIREKGSSTPLIRSGQFRSSIAPRLVTR